MPFTRFQTWYQAELTLSKASLPAACCLSSIGLDGFPNARFVSLKEIRDDAFVVTGSMDSRKGQELRAKPQAALTFWWPATGRQVRIQGVASPIPAELADCYFHARNRASKIVSMVSKQGKATDAINALRAEYESVKSSIADADIQRPSSWGGWYIRPIRMEFLDFSDDRFHARRLYRKDGETWMEAVLEP